MQGQIVKIICDLHYVSYKDMIIPCKCRGIFRKEHIIPVVGDFVFFNINDKIIEKILPRKNEFLRPKVSNIDQAFIITSMKNPDFSLNLLDKLIIMMELHNVESIICITKSDLIDDISKYEDIFNYYRNIGYKVIFNNDINTMKLLIKNKTSVFIGQTGAGKSTILNKLCPELNLETGEISLALGRGKHTTRIVSLYNLLDGKLMDTPGFSSLDFSGYTKKDIRNAFVEFRDFPCPFKDCMHTNEQECVIKQEVKDNNIMESRYLNYLNFIGGNGNENKCIIFK